MLSSLAELTYSALQGAAAPISKKIVRRLNTKESWFIILVSGSLCCFMTRMARNNAIVAPLFKCWSIIANNCAVDSRRKTSFLRGKKVAGVLDSVNQRTQLVGQNRLELLLFRLAGSQVFGINVFKVKEVLQCPKLTTLPKSNPVVKGVAHIRGGTIPVLDMGMATGQRAVSDTDLDDHFIIITEYNRKTQGFLVSGVERIVNLNWEEIHPPPKGSGRENYLTAVTEIDNKLVEILDVEKILAEVSPMDESVKEETLAHHDVQEFQKHKILVVDDSVVARKQVKNCLQAIGAEVVLMNDGRQAYDHLREITADGTTAGQHYSMMISDVEMPEMDGYTLTAKCKSEALLADLYIMLHTSLSGVFNQAMVKKVGADDFMAKFSPDELAERVMGAIEKNWFKKF